MTEEEDKAAIFYEGQVDEAEQDDILAKALISTMPGLPQPIPEPEIDLSILPSWMSDGSVHCCPRCWHNGNVVGIGLGSDYANKRWNLNQSEMECPVCGYSYPKYAIDPRTGRAIRDMWVPVHLPTYQRMIIQFDMMIVREPEQGADGRWCDEENWITWNDRPAKAAAKRIAEEKKNRSRYTRNRRRKMKAEKKRQAEQRKLREAL